MLLDLSILTKLMQNMVVGNIETLELLDCLLAHSKGMLILKCAQIKVATSKAWRKRVSSHVPEAIHGLVPKLLSGFGWVNFSYVYGLTIVNTHMRRALVRISGLSFSLFQPES